MNYIYNDFSIKLTFWQRLKFLFSNKLKVRLTLEFKGEGSIYITECKLEKVEEVR
ncbi:MAG: hypothetical protein H0Z24_05775 [Thermosipho sp. (in: Bacteria)]|nr:hypothetical protein [Thermosipho sp. (in: thermotogales)]